MKPALTLIDGAAFLGIGDEQGTLAPGKLADLVLVQGNPAERIADVEKVEWVWKNGVAYDAVKLAASVRGLVGLQ